MMITLSFLRNQDWKEIKVENGKGNKLLNIPTCNITELIYKGVKIVGDKIGVFLRTPDRNIKAGFIGVTANWPKSPKRDFIFARVKTGQVGTWSPME